MFTHIDRVSGTLKRYMYLNLYTFTYNLLKETSEIHNRNRNTRRTCRSRKYLAHTKGRNMPHKQAVQKTISWNMWEKWHKRYAHTDPFYLYSEWIVTARPKMSRLFSYQKSNKKVYTTIIWINSRTMLYFSNKHLIMNKWYSLRYTALKFQ